MRFDGKIRQNRICGKLIQTQKIISHGSRPCGRPRKLKGLLKNLLVRARDWFGNSNSRTNLKTAKASFRTPKTTFSTVPKACGYLENKKFEGR
jgi:hypothetical protein